jgi:hypothetical protein
VAPGNFVSVPSNWVKSPTGWTTTVRIDPVSGFFFNAVKHDPVSGRLVDGAYVCDGPCCDIDAVAEAVIEGARNVHTNARAQRQTEALVRGSTRAASVSFDPYDAQLDAAESDPTWILDDDEVDGLAAGEAMRRMVAGVARVMSMSSANAQALIDRVDLAHRAFRNVGPSAHFLADVIVSPFCPVPHVVTADEITAHAAPPPGMLTDDEHKGALNKRRHGSASVCPRHGATTGGLCRKCQR